MRFARRSTVISFVAAAALVFSVTSITALPALPLPHPTLTDLLEDRVVRYRLAYHHHFPDCSSLIMCRSRWASCLRQPSQRPRHKKS